MDKVKTLSEAIDLVLGSTNQITLLLEKNAVKPLPATRTPKVKKKEIKEPQPVEEPVKEPVKAEEVRTEPPVKDSEPLVAAQAPVELQAEPRTYQESQNPHRVNMRLGRLYLLILSHALILIQWP